MVKCNHNFSYYKTFYGTNSKLPLILCILFSKEEVIIRRFICSNCGEFKDISRLIKKEAGK